MSRKAFGKVYTRYTQIVQTLSEREKVIMAQY